MSWAGWLAIAFGAWIVADYVATIRAGVRARQRNLARSVAPGFAEVVLAGLALTLLASPFVVSLALKHLTGDPCSILAVRSGFAPVRVGDVVTLSGERPIITVLGRPGQTLTLRGRRLHVVGWDAEFARDVGRCDHVVPPGHIAVAATGNGARDCAFFRDVPAAAIESRLLVAVWPPSRLGERPWGRWPLDAPTTPRR